MSCKTTYHNALTICRNAQNETEHTTPDWKLHLSCDLEHIGPAWNSLVALFIDMKCEIGMKVTVLNSEQWSESQRGREITVYIYNFHYSYRDYMQGVVPEHDHDLYLGHELTSVYNTPFWYKFILEAEKRMEAIGAISRGVADGDLALPGCRYTSLRNEAYVSVPVSCCASSIDSNAITHEEARECPDTDPTLRPHSHPSSTGMLLCCWL